MLRNAGLGDSSMVLAHLGALWEEWTWRRVPKGMVKWQGDSLGGIA